MEYIHTLKKLLHKIPGDLSYKNWSFGRGSFVPHIRSIEGWIERNSTRKGVYVNNWVHQEYPEVTGYWLETLLKWGYTDKAKTWFAWLKSIQHDDGGWPGEDLGKSSTFFDSGQIIRGIKAYSDYTGVDARKIINNYLSFFDKRYVECCIPHSPQGNVDWHLINLQVVWIVHKYWPSHVNLPLLKKKLRPYLKKWQVGYNISHFDIYILEALYELDLAPVELKKYIRYFDTAVKKYELVPCDRENHAPCYTASAQLGVLYYKMGRRNDAEHLLFRMLKDLDLKKGNWPGSADGGNYHVNREVSWGLKYFLDLLYTYATTGFALEEQGEWNHIENSFHERILAKLEASTTEKSTVLDIGCGLGRYMERLATHHDVYGVDISDENVKICRKKKLRVVNTSFTELAIPKTFPSKFDLIYSVEAFEHAVFPGNALRQAAARLARNGRLVIVDKDFYECLSYKLCPFERYYTRDEMKALASVAGLTVCSFSDISGFLVTEMRRS